MAKTIKIDITCPFCGKEYQVEVPAEGYKRWREGALIQRAMPTVVPEDREALISSICSECWDKTFGGENYED